MKQEQQQQNGPTNSISNPETGGNPVLEPRRLVPERDEQDFRTQYRNRLVSPKFINNQNETNDALQEVISDTGKLNGGVPDKAPEQRRTVVVQSRVVESPAKSDSGKSNGSQKGQNGLNSDKVKVDACIQTDMTGEQVETKTRASSRTRISSGDSSISCSTDVSLLDGKVLTSTSTSTNILSPVRKLEAKDGSASLSPESAARKDLNKVPSFIRIDHTDSAACLPTQAVKDRTARRKKKRGPRSSERKRNISGGSTDGTPKTSLSGIHLEIGSVESGSSGEFPEGGKYFWISVLVIDRFTG